MSLSGELRCPSCGHVIGHLSQKEAKPKRQKSSIAWSQEASWTGISDDDKQRWKTAFPACDIDRLLVVMDDWLRSHPQQAHKSRWSAFISRWLTKEQDRGGDYRTRLGGGVQASGGNASRVYSDPTKYAGVGTRISPSVHAIPPGDQPGVVEGRSKPENDAGSGTLW